MNLHTTLELARTTFEIVGWITLAAVLITEYPRARTWLRNRTRRGSIDKDLLDKITRRQAEYRALERHLADDSNGLTELERYTMRRHLDDRLAELQHLNNLRTGPDDG